MVPHLLHDDHEDMTRDRGSRRRGWLLATAILLLCGAFVFWQSRPVGGDDDDEIEAIASAWTDSVEGRNPATPGAWRSELLDSTSAAKRRFSARHYRSYEVTVTPICFCFLRDDAGNFVRSFKVHVDNGKVTRFTAIGSRRDAPRQTVDLESWDRVPDEFRWVERYAVIERAFDKVASSPLTYDSVTFRADASTGVPQSYSIDPRRTTFDDELTIIWTHFRAA